MAGHGLFLVRMDIAHDHEKTFNEVYDKEHVPNLRAAPGVVVYSGSGLLGYGRLVIIKHDDTYLSAYAHNERLMVQEGDRVTHAQQIATMGLGNAGRPVLHFEIRKDGKPVNPLDYLPKRSS